MSFPVAPTNNQKYLTSDGRIYIYSSANKTWDAVSSETLVNLKHNYAATGAPTVSDDSNAGYGLGSLWINPTTRDIYRLVDATPGAAVWRYQDNSVSATPPAAPLIGQLYYNSTDGFTYIYNGSAWVDITASTATVTNNMNAIVPPTAGDDAAGGYSVGSRWIVSATGAAYVCVNSSNGAAVWKIIGGDLFTPLAADPATPAAGDVWYNTTTNLYRGFDGVVKTFTIV